MLPLTEYLGIGRHLSATGMFYAQAEAVCQYLYQAEDGRHRPKLLQYLGNYYSGKKASLKIRTAFGMSEKDLGRKVKQYAKRVQAAAQRH